MSDIRTLADWLQFRGWQVGELVEATGLDHRVVEAMAAGRYTPSPAQRQRVASALQVDASQIAWGHVTAVDHMYGHGPQFGRSP
jgi:hypothetical protein